MRAILHIGFPKTGTSPVQNYCSQAYAELTAEGILFSKAGRILSFKDRRHHMGLSFACQPLDLPTTTMLKIHEVTSGYSKKLYRKRFFSRLTHALHKCELPKIAAFSAEALSIGAMIRAIKNKTGKRPFVHAAAWIKRRIYKLRDKAAILNGGPHVSCKANCRHL